MVKISNNKDFEYSDVKKIMSKIIEEDIKYKTFTNDSVEKAFKYLTTHKLSQGKKYDQNSLYNEINKYKEYSLKESLLYQNLHLNKDYENIAQYLLKCVGALAAIVLIAKNKQNFDKLSNVVFNLLNQNDAAETTAESSFEQPSNEVQTLGNENPELAWLVFKKIIGASYL